ncbi:MAG: glycosyltransferase family 4 protein [Candidatus Auribacterota bacterium]|nr:glycosyltransferase family 4 protein [Candidatus Auribacterota bacterium]
MTANTTSPHWKIAYICPRYAAGSAGGAEALIKNWAEGMRDRGHSSEVLTTCARDNTTWENELPPGEEVINGVTIRRFEVTSHNQEKQDYFGEKISHGQPLSLSQEEEWIDSVVRSDVLINFIAEHHSDYDYLIFAPYLFGITCRGLAIAPERSILVPCLHDEPYARLKIFHRLFNQAAGIFFNSEAEQALAARIFPPGEATIRLVGMGIEPPDNLDPETFQKKYKEKSPFILYAGRREGGKNTPLLLEYFRIFKRHHRTDLKLLLIGSGYVDLRREDKNNIRDLGYISSKDKWNAYAASDIFCQPSNNESFSIVLLESWITETPALVSGLCPVTRDHCLRSQGGLFFRNYYEFEECILYLLKNPDQAKLMGENGRKYVKNNYTWKNVLDRLEEGIENCLK